MDGRSTRLERWGRASWLALGIIAFAAVVHAGLSAMSGLVVPLVIAVVIGMLAVPLVDRLERRGVGRGVGAALVMIGLIVIGAGSVAIAVSGMIDQSDEVTQQITAGVTTRRRDRRAQLHPASTAPPGRITSSGPRRSEW